MTDGNIEMRSDARKQLCPLCGKKGTKVKPITVESLLTDEAKARLSRADGFRFCLTLVCETTYYHPETGERFRVEDVRVRVGQKETEASRPICYCFDYTVEEIEAEVARSGASKIPDKIRTKCKEGLSRCEETNPQGSCCLGNVRKVVKEAQEKYSTVTAGQSHSETATEDSPDCCASEASSDRAQPGSSRNPKNWVTGGAVLAAVLSSVCCWLPLVLIAFGASAAGVSGFF